MNNSAIGIFDSGLGGLTVATEVARALPKEKIIYIGDTKRCPYGPQDPKKVKDYVIEICSYFKKLDVKLIVIACNTATAAGLVAAQETFDIPIIGVVEPGARAAVRATKNRRLGVIGTTGTIDSNVYSEAVRALDAGATVFSVATPQFVDIVEEGLVFDGDDDVESHIRDIFIRPSFYKTARNYLDALRQKEIDTLILGCTHFPLLSTAIAQVMGKKVELISSAEETAQEVLETLERRGDLASRSFDPEHLFLTTGDVASFKEKGERIFGPDMKNVEAITIKDLETARKELGY